MTVGPTVWPSSLVSTPCEVSASTKRAPAGLDLGLVDGLLRRAGEVVRRRQHPLAALGAGPELELGLLDSNQDRRRTGRRQRARRSGLRGLAGSSQSSSSAASYTRRHRQLARAPGGRSSASTCCRTPCAPCARSAWPPHRHPCRCCDSMRSQRCPGQRSARRRRTPRRARRWPRRRRSGCAAARRRARRSIRRPYRACRSRP